jgi:hypothetical protein
VLTLRILKLPKEVAAVPPFARGSSGEAFVCKNIAHILYVCANLRKSLVSKPANWVLKQVAENQQREAGLGLLGIGVKSNPFPFLRGAVGLAVFLFEI